LYFVTKEVEQSAVSKQKAQLGENIEVIKLRRQNKKLESQLRVADHSSKLLEQDVSRLKTESEEALRIIAEKQNEIIDMQSKLDEACKVQLELQETKESVMDLKVHTFCLLPQRQTKDLNDDLSSSQDRS